MFQKKIKFYLEMLALIVGVCTITVITFFLATRWEKAIFFTEIIIWIRIPEVILGLISIPILCLMIISKLKEKLREDMKNV